MIIKKIKATILQISAFLICFLILINGVFAQQNKEVKVGILLGFTGNVESLTPSMADSAEMAFNEIASDMNLTNEISFKIQRADTTCNDMSKAKNAAKKLVEDGVAAVIGAACPDITMKIAEEIFIPKKVLMISPVDSSNELIGLKDNDFVFRTTPPKIRGSQILADITKDRGVRNLAISYSSDRDYKKFAESYDKALKEKNIKTLIMVPHNQNSSDYSKHISTLSAAGGEALAVISDINLGGVEVIQSMLDIGMFSTFILPDSMIEEKIINSFKEKNLKKSFGFMPGLSNLGSKKFVNLAQKSGIDPDSPYTSESYDAAAIIILSNFAKIYSEYESNNDVYNVANKPGIKIYPGEIKKAINILREGKQINYEGATGVEFDKFGDTLGSFLEVDFKKGKLKSKKLR
tara:strand:+ start:2052 stop:3269 length:1218 start_codon:yes stop_codon:yes gene_type:complete